MSYGWALLPADHAPSCSALPELPELQVGIPGTRTLNREQRAEILSRRAETLAGQISGDAQADPYVAALSALVTDMAREFYRLTHAANGVL